MSITWEELIYDLYMKRLFFGWFNNEYDLFDLLQLLRTPLRQQCYLVIVNYIKCYTRKRKLLELDYYSSNKRQTFKSRKCIYIYITIKKQGYRMYLQLGKTKLA